MEFVQRLASSVRSIMTRLVARAPVLEEKREEVAPVMPEIEPVLTPDVEQAVVVEEVQSITDHPDYIRAQAEVRAYAELCANLQAQLVQVQGFAHAGPDVTELLRRQLDQTNATTETAAVQIMQRLIAVEGEASQLLDSQKAGTERAAALHQSAGVLLSDSQKHLEAMEEFRRDREAALAVSSAENAAVMRILHRVSDLKNVASSIQNVTKMTNLLAVNAAIEAARAGEKGKGFAAVSIEVRSLSGQIAALAKRIEESIDEVSTSVNTTFGARVATLGGEGAKSEMDETHWINTMSATIGQLSSDFSRTIAEFDQMTHSTYNAAASIKAAIVDVLGYAQFQDTTRQQIEQVQTGLTLFAQRLDTLEHSVISAADGPSEIEPLSTLLEHLNSTYTMASQRDIHAQSTGESAADADQPMIELF